MVIMTTMEMKIISDDDEHDDDLTFFWLWLYLTIR